MEILAYLRWGNSKSFDIFLEESPVPDSIRLAVSEQTPSSAENIGSLEATESTGAVFMTFFATGEVTTDFVTRGLSEGDLFLVCVVSRVVVHDILAVPVCLLTAAVEVGTGIPIEVVDNVYTLACSRRTWRASSCTLCNHSRFWTWSASTLLA